MTNVTNPANICFRNILSRVYFYTAKMKPSFTFVAFNSIFFKLIWIFLTILMTDIIQVHRFSRFFGFFLYVSWFSFDFLFWGNPTLMVVLATFCDVLCSLSLRFKSLFLLKEMVSFLWSLLYNKYASLLCQNQANFFKVLPQYISSKKKFFLNHWMCKQKTKNVYNWQ